MRYKILILTTNLFLQKLLLSSKPSYYTIDKLVQKKKVILFHNSIRDVCKILK